MKGNKAKLLTTLKWSILSLLSGLIGLEIYLYLSVAQHGASLWRVLVLIVIIGILCYRNKYVWIFSIAFFVIGLYQAVVNNASPTAFAFTAGLKILLLSSTTEKTQIYLTAFPALFYLSAILGFSSIGVRRRYHIAGKRPPKMKAYL